VSAGSTREWWVPDGTAARRVAVVPPGGEALAALPALLAVRSASRDLDVGLRHPPLALGRRSAPRAELPRRGGGHGPLRRLCRLVVLLQPPVLPLLPGLYHAYAQDQCDRGDSGRPACCGVDDLVADGQMRRGDGSSWSRLLLDDLVQQPPREPPQANREVSARQC
jgi:hypothetical protein